MAYCSDLEEEDKGACMDCVFSIGVSGLSSSSESAESENGGETAGEGNGGKENAGE